MNLSLYMGLPLRSLIRRYGYTRVLSWLKGDYSPDEKQFREIIDMGYCRCYIGKVTPK